MKIKKGDNVIVIAGKSKGQSGKVIKSIPSQNRVVVEGANKVSRRMKAKKRGEKGSVVEREAAMHVSNVRLANSKKADKSK